jgi:predicted PurR-regulated permease PerM
MNKGELNISWGAIWRVFWMVAFVASLYYMRDVLGVLLVSIILSSAIYGPIDFLERKKIPRVLAVVMIYLVGASIVALLLYAIIPLALIQLKYFLSHLNELKIPLLEFFGSWQIVSQIDQSINNFINAIFYSNTSLSDFISGFLSKLFFAVVALVISFYLSLRKDGVESFIRAILPPQKEDLVVNLYIRTRKKLTRWLSGQIILSIIMGALTFLGLSILGIDYAFILALLAAVLEVVPYVGPITVGTVVFLMSLSQSITTALLALLVFLVIQQLENHIIVPIVMSKAVGTDPVVILIAMLAGGQIAGIVGVLVAVPVVIFFEEIINEWNLIKRQNIKESSV